jgi:hypothetical protein
VLDLIEPHSEADPAALLTTFLAMFGACVGAGPHTVADGAKHSARLFPLHVGDTSKARKGTALANIRNLMFQVDPNFCSERILGGFGSGEALVDAVTGDDHRLLVTEPEFARILDVARREGSTLSAIVRQAWDGDRLQVRTRGNKAVAADGAHVVIIGQITGGELRAKLTATEIAAGFANRFLIICVRRSKLLPSGGNLNDLAVAQVAGKIRAAVQDARVCGLLRRSSEAERRWHDLYHEMADDVPSGLLGEIIARDTAQVLRLSVAYALLDGSAQIELCHLEAAWAIWQYCRQSAEHLFGDATGDPVADRIFAALGEHGLDREEQSALFSRHVPVKRLAEARSLLIGRGLAVEFDESTDGRTRKLLRRSEGSEVSEEKGTRP